VLVLASAAATAWYLAPEPEPPTPAFAGEASVLPVGAPPEVSLLVTNYEGLSQRLYAEFERVRHRLPPGTTATVAANLAVIDSALAEIRVVLESEPDNAVLIELLASTYRQKVSVLEHATESVS
jgi:hypothetical protein